MRRSSIIVTRNTVVLTRVAYLVDKKNLTISEPYVISSEKERLIYLSIQGTTAKYMKEDYATKWFTDIAEARKYVRDECRRRYKEAKRQAERWK